MLKSKLTLFLMLAVLTVGTFAQSIPSGTGRIEALANSPFILDAATDINNNPAWNNYYRDYAFGDFGRNVISDFELSDQYGGATFGIGKQWNLGFVVNKSQGRFGNFGDFGNDSNAYNTGNIYAPVVPIKILIGYSLKKDFHVGLAPYIAMGNSDVTKSDTTVGTGDDSKRSSSRLGATLGFLKMVKKGWFEATINFGMNKYKNELTSGSSTSTYESEGGTEISVGLRGWLHPKTNSKVAVIPILGFSMYSWNPKMTSGSTTTTGFKNSLLDVNGGVGFNWPISDDIQIAAGIWVDYESKKREVGTDTALTYTTGHTKMETNTFVLPGFNFAGETRIADWLTARFGFSRSILRKKDTHTYTGSSTEEYSWNQGSSSANTVSLGAGFHFGRFSIDATVSEQWLKRGINFVSGQNNDLFGVISGSYNFGK